MLQQGGGGQGNLAPPRVAAPAPHPSGGFLGTLSHIPAAVGNTVAHATGAPVPQGAPMLRYHPSTGVTTPGQAAAQQLQKMGLGPQMAQGALHLPGLGGAPFSQWKAANDWKQAFEQQPQVNPVVDKVIQGMHDWANAKAPIAANIAAQKLATQQNQFNKQVGGLTSEGLHLRDLSSGTGGGGTPLAASLGSSILNSGVAKVAGHLGSDIINLPDNMIKGSWGLGNAVGSGLRTGNFDQAGHMVSQMAQTDPLIQLVTGHPGTALKLAGQHPLNAALDVTGLYGLAGRTAGGLARVGAFGGAASDAANLARIRELAPGVPGTAVSDPYSRNLFTQLAQKSVEAHPNFGATLTKMRDTFPTAKMGYTGTQGALRKQAAMYYGPAKSQLVRDVAQNAKDTLATKPAGKVEANVTPYLAAFGGGQDTLQAALQHLYEAQKGPSAAGAALKTQNQHIANLEAAGNKPGLNLPAMHDAAAAYAARQATLEAQKKALGLHAPAEHIAALEKQFALQQIPGTHFIDTPVTHPDAIVARQQAGAALREATKNLETAKVAAASDKSAHAAGGAMLTNLAKRLPVHPVTDSLGNHVLDLKTMLDQSRAERAPMNAETVAAAKDAKAAAVSDYANAKKYQQKIGGVVVDDPTARPIASGQWKGMQVRPLSSTEIRAHMGATGGTPSYLRMTNPERDQPATMADLRGGQQARSSATGGTYTGRAARTGDWTPGWKSMVRSQRRDVMNIGKAKMDQGFLDRFGARDANGQPYDAYNAPTAADAYTHQTGIPVQPMELRPGSGEFVLVPKVMAKEMSSQFKLESPTVGGRIAMGSNRLFRNTVLPMSPKLPIMHTVENSLRAARAGATPMGWMLARNTLKDLSPADAARLKDLAMPGGMAGHFARMSQEDLGHLAPTDQSLGRQVLGAPNRLWEPAASGIIGVQRWMERHAQQAALGSTLRQTMQEQGVPWAKAVTATKPTDELTHAYSTPAYQDAAGLRSHEQMGQYSNFGGATRWTTSRVSPFLPWYLNAGKLAYHGLPTKNPIFTNVTTTAANANAPAFKAEHLGLPSYLQDAEKIGPGHFLDVSKFTPIGVKPTLQEITQLLVPQYQAPVAALAGLDPFLKPMRGVTPLYGDAALHALSAALENILGPTATVARGLQSNGQTLKNTSMPIFGQVTRKPGTGHGPGGLLGGLLKEVNPFRGVYYNGGGGGGTGSATYGGYSGGTSTPGQATYGGY